MRRFCITLGGLLLVPIWATAQQPAAADPNAAKMDEILTQWEKAMTNLNSVHTAVSRNTIKKTFQTVEKFSGEAKFLKTGANQPCRASLYLAKDKMEQDVYEKYICTGTYIFSFDPANKVIKYAEQQRAGQGHLGDNFLEFLFGMKKEEATKRYRFIYVPSDKNYHYLRVLPRYKEDEKQFKEARVALNVTNFLPRQLWLLQSNDDEVTWDFPRMNVNIEIRPQEFENPAQPKGWKTEKFQKDK